MDIARNIFQFFHCRECLEEWKAGEAPGESPKSYARFSVGFTALGLQVVCNRHDLNVVHIDFEGQQHPADQSKEGDFGGTYWAMVEARQKANQDKEKYPRIRDEFPDFDLATLPAIPADWVEDSWHNDTCPSFTAHDGKLKIFVDYDVAELREFPEIAFRYSVSSLNEDSDVLHHLETNDWPAVVAFVESWREPCTTGHTDTGRGVCADCGLILVK